jgi:dihydroneopterin aldolase
MASDWIRLTDIALYGCHGVTPAERQVGRLFEVEVELKLDLGTAAETDDLRTTVDYVAVYEIVQRVHEAGPYQLLEAMAGRIANQIIAAFPVDEVTVRVRKPHPPVGGLVGAAEIEIRRNREQGLGSRG